jgi:hypothetical protein
MFCLHTYRVKYISWEEWPTEMFAALCSFRDKHTHPAGIIIEAALPSQEEKQNRRN